MGSYADVYRCSAPASPASPHFLEHQAAKSGLCRFGDLRSDLRSGTVQDIVIRKISVRACGRRACMRTDRTYARTLYARTGFLFPLDSFFMIWDSVGLKLFKRRTASEYYS